MNIFEYIVENSNLNEELSLNFKHGGEMLKIKKDFFLAIEHVEGRGENIYGLYFPYHKGEKVYLAIGNIKKRMSENYMPKLLEAIVALYTYRELCFTYGNGWEYPDEVKIILRNGNKYVKMSKDKYNSILETVNEHNKYNDDFEDRIRTELTHEAKVGSEVLYGGRPNKGVGIRSKRKGRVKNYNPNLKKI